MAKQVKSPKKATGGTLPLPDNPQMRYSKSIAKQETEFFRRMADAQERIARAVEKQQPSRMSQIFVMMATGVTIFGIVGIIDVIKKWIGG